MILNNFQHKVWPEIGQNKESVGELWLGLLRFYTEEFDFRRHVVAIKQKSLLTTFEKVSRRIFISQLTPMLPSRLLLSLSGLPHCIPPDAHYLIRCIVWRENVI